MNRFLFLTGLILMVFLAGLSLAGIPKMINYQGMLTDNSGTPLNGNYSITFKIYNAVSDGTIKWEETQSSVSVTHGLFNVILGSVTPIDLDFSEDYWLDLTVAGETMPTRLKFTSVGYAYRAQNADTADYARGGGGGGGSPWIFRISDGSDTTITTGGGWGVARFGNQLFGNADSTHVNLGVASTTGINGLNYKYCTVGGGVNNIARGDNATVGGGTHNTASGYIATVGGGSGDTASGYNATVGGGNDNTASGSYTTVGGGLSNIASATYANVGGGHNNNANASNATVGGGSDNIASGDFSVIPGGFSDTITSNGDYSMIFGRGVYVNNSYRVAFFDGSYSGRLGINRDDRDGGISYPIHVGTNTSNGNGAYLTGGGTWSNGSSRSFKENFQPLNSQELLEKISSIPVEAWNYKNSEERHIGPVAEDFVSAFDVGTIRDDGARDNKYLSAGDIAGVALAGVKELINENQELTRIIKEQQKDIQLLKDEIKGLRIDKR